MTTTSYDASHIKQLEGLEAIRRLPGMYIGNNNVYGLHHLLMELIDNAVDEIMNGHGSTIRVSLHADGSASVVDDARGIPVAYKPDTGVSALTQVLTVLHAGGKFRDRSDDGQDAYLSGSGGLHGIGAKATNAFSEWLAATVRRHGVIFRQRFENGGQPVTGVEIVEPGTGRVVGEVNAGTELVTKKGGPLTGLKIGGRTIPVQADPELGTGTEIHFRPNRDWFDPEMEWPRKSIPWDFSRLATRLEQIAHLHPGVRIELGDRRGPKKSHKRRVYHSGKGLLDYIAVLNEGTQPLHRPIHFTGANDEGSISVEVVIQYAGEETQIYSFVNSIPTPLGGTAVSGFQAGLTKAVKQFATDKKLAKGTSIRGDDVLLGLTAIVNVTMSKTPQFSSQTKEALTTTEAQGVAMSVTYEHVLAYLGKHVSVGKAIVKQAEAAWRGREAAKAARQLVIRRSALDAPEAGVLGKLADVARGSPVAQTTLYIVEGDSAGGSCKQARDRRYHAILPLRGKILNTEKARLTRVLANSEVKAIIAAIGAGVGPDFELGRMRYGRVGILVDADVDGAHIRTLLHTLFWRHMKPLVQAGRLYVALAPLYQLRKGEKTRYAYSDQERDAILAEWGTGDVTIQRYKGLGEMNPEQLRETVFRMGETGGRHMLQVTVDDVHHTGQVMSALMGSAVGPRKAWLMARWAGEEAPGGDNGMGGDGE